MGLGIYELMATSQEHPCWHFADRAFWFVLRRPRTLVCSSQTVVCEGQMCTVRRTEKKNVVARQIQIGVGRLSSPIEEEVSEELLRHLLRNLLLLPTYPASTHSPRRRFSSYHTPRLRYALIN